VVHTDGLNVESSAALDFRSKLTPAGCVSTRFPIVRGSATDGLGWSAGDTRNPCEIIELEMVARDATPMLAQVADLFSWGSRFS
jgi:hypothetical protein